MGLSLFGFLLPVALILQLLVSSAPRDVLKNLAGESMAEAIVTFMVCILVFFLLAFVPHSSSRKLKFNKTLRVLKQRKGRYGLAIELLYFLSLQNHTNRSIITMTNKNIIL